LTNPRMFFVLPIGANILKNTAFSIPHFGPPRENFPGFGFFLLVLVLPLQVSFSGQTYVHSHLDLYVEIGLLFGVDLYR
jgi:hypothetical protein